MRTFIFAGGLALSATVLTLGRSAHATFLTLFHVGYSVPAKAKSNVNKVCLPWIREAEVELGLRASAAGSSGSASARKLWLTLPTQVEISSERELKTFRDPEESWCNGGFTIPILSPEPPGRSVGASRAVEKLKLILRSGQEFLVEFELDPALNLKTEMTLVTDREGGQRISLSPRLRGGIGQLLMGRELPYGTDYKLQLEVIVAGQSATFAVAEWPPSARANFERTFFLNPLKYANVFYYQARCADLLTAWLGREPSFSAH